MIHSTSNSTPLPGVITPGEGKPAAKPVPAASSPDTLDTTASTALRAALAAQPEVRPEVVEQGRTLATDANYPPRAIIEDLARLLINSQDPANQA